MEYPWIDKFIVNSAEDTPPDEETGTNQPVEPDEEPNPELAKDIVEGEPQETYIEPETINNLQTQIEDLQKQIEDLQKQDDLEVEIERIKNRLDNISVPDDTDLNDSLFQSASSKIKYLKRAIRRIKPLNSEQITQINLKLEQKPQMSCQEIALDLAKTIGAKEQDIIDYIRNSEFRFRHRHWRESSVINWEEIN